MRILISALSCNAALGSEALVGFKYAEALARRHEVTVVASPPSQTPAGATLAPCDAGPCSFNEVSAVALMRFELRQWRLARGLMRREEFDYVHRVTPSAIQLPTWAWRLGRPLVVGPLIAAERPPASFEEILGRAMSAPKRPRWHPARVMARLCAEMVGRAGARQEHLARADRILVGTRAALQRVPERWRVKCRLVTYSGVEHEAFVSAECGRRSAESPMRLLFVGRLVPYKGAELLLRAMAVAINGVAAPGDGRAPRMRLDVVGDGDARYKEYLMGLCGELGIGNLVNFLPARPRTELLKLYQAAEVFCFP